MKSYVPRALIYLPILFLSFFVSCGGGGSSDQKPTKAVRTVAFIPNTSSDFWKVARKGCEKADAELTDIAVVFKTPYDGTPVAQNRLIREALDRDNADAIAVSPIDPVGQKSHINEAAKRALVITQDSDAPDSDRVLYLGADNLAAGRQAGELLKKALPQGGKVMVFVGKSELQNSRERYQGLKESLQGSKVEVVDIMTDDNDPSRARGNAVETLTKHPEVVGMVGLWSYNGPAILQALKNEDKVGKVKIVCFDDEKETLEGIKSGAIFASVAQQPFEYGYQVVKLAATILKGDRSGIPSDKQVFIPTVVIQRENVDEFSKILEQHLSGK